MNISVSKSMPQLCLYATLAGFITSTAAAQDLGLQAAQLALTAEESGQNAGGLYLDYAITEHHNFALNFDLFETDVGTIGAVRAGLSLSPAADRRYGLFAYLADMNNESSRWGGVGLQGRRQIAGLGIGGFGGIALRDSTMAARPLGDADVLFAGGELRLDLGEAWQAFAKVNLADFDELQLSTTLVWGEVGVLWQDPPDRYALVASYGFEEFSNHRLYDTTRIRLGVDIKLGRGGSTRALPFADPFLPVVARGF
ncbi:hypothetical protein OE810_11340 [Rhodobacteraceae bacterium XHP0102]|nr:hypothetical protein [Rhodobacteraceae bacterium XHP0102]